MYTYSTGLMNNGWAFTGSFGYRWAKEGNIDGTFYNSFSYFLAAQKVFNEQHSLSISTWGAPTERGQQGASTEEAYYLANSHYYNPNWGYQNGESVMQELLIHLSLRLWLHGTSTSTKK